MLRRNLFMAAAVCAGAFVAESSAALRFTNAVTASVSDYGESLAFADMNRDGRLDVITGSQILLQQPDGSLLYKGSFSGNWPPSVEIADFNGDGFPDIVRSGRVFINRGDGVVDFLTNLPGLGGGSSDRNKSGDFNRDGRLDVVTYDSQQVLRVWLGDGTGRFNAVVESNRFDRFWCDIDTADFNRDGALDVALFRGETGDSNTVVVLLGRNDGTFHPPTSYNRGHSYDRARIHAADLDLDSFPDVVTAGYYTQTAISLRAGEGGTLQPPLKSGRGGAYHFELADLNGDELPDQVLVVNGGLYVSLGRGDGTFTNQPALPLYGISNPSWTALAVGDYNGDLKPDLLISHSTASAYQVTVLTNYSDLPAVRPALRLLSVKPEVLTWPRLSNGFFHVEYRPLFHAIAPWQPLTNPVVAVGNSFYATNRSVGGRAFYRLRRD